MHSPWTCARQRPQGTGQQLWSSAILPCRPIIHSLCRLPTQAAECIWIIGTRVYRCTLDGAAGEVEDDTASSASLETSAGVYAVDVLATCHAVVVCCAVCSQRP